MRGSLRRLLFAILPLVILGVLAYRARGVIQLQNFSWGRLWFSLRQAQVSYLLFSVMAIYAGYAMRALRWRRFCRYLGRPSFWGLYTSTLMGFTALFLLGRAGEPVRPIIIAKKENLPVASMFGIYVVERLFDGASTATVAGISLLMFPHMLSSGGQAGHVLQTLARTAGLALLVVFLVMLAFLVYVRVHGSEALERRLQGWRGARGWKRRAAMIFLGFFGGLQAIQSLADLAVAVIYSALHWTLVALIYLWVPRAFGGQLGDIGFIGALLVLFFTMVGSALQLPAVGGGSQAASFLAFTVVFGVEKEPAAAASIVLWLITFAAASLAGVPLLIREGWSMGELRRLARAEAEAESPGARVEAPEGQVPPQVGTKSGEPQQ